MVIRLVSLTSSFWDVRITSNKNVKAIVDLSEFVDCEVDARKAAEKLSKATGLKIARKIVKIR